MVTAPVVGFPIRQGVPWLGAVMNHHEKGIPLSLDVESHRRFMREHALTCDSAEMAHESGIYNSGRSCYLLATAKCTRGYSGSI